jgi:hypothetical protein
MSAAAIPERGLCKPTKYSQIHLTVAIYIVLNRMLAHLEFLTIQEEELHEPKRKGSDQARTARSRRLSYSRSRDSRISSEVTG